MLEEGRDFAAQVQTTKSEQLIKVAGDRLRLTWVRRFQQELVINGVPRRVNFIAFLPGVAGKAAKIFSASLRSSIRPRARMEMSRSPLMEARVGSYFLLKFLWDGSELILVFVPARVATAAPVFPIRRPAPYRG